FGISKLMPYKNKPDEYIRVNMELTKMEQTIDRIIRQAGEWYSHHQLVHGYTNKGEVLGAGIGPGSNLQSLDLGWIKGVKQIGVQFDRYVHNNDLYYNRISPGNNTKNGQWVDLSAGAF